MEQWHPLVNHHFGMPSGECTYHGLGLELISTLLEDLPEERRQTIWHRRGIVGVWFEGPIVTSANLDLAYLHLFYIFLLLIYLLRLFTLISRLAFYCDTYFNLFVLIHLFVFIYLFGTRDGRTHGREENHAWLRPQASNGWSHGALALHVDCSTCLVGILPRLCMPKMDFQGSNCMLCVSGYVVYQATL